MSSNRHIRNNTSLLSHSEPGEQIFIGTQDWTRAKHNINTTLNNVNMLHQLTIELIKLNTIQRQIVPHIITLFFLERTQETYRTT